MIGLALGGALALGDRLLEQLFAPLLSALLVLCLWKVATGGIHLDGLADSLDGLAGRDADHRLTIMRDSRIGVFGALGLILVFLVGVFALAEIPGPIRWRVLLLAPAVGRLMPVLVGRWFPPASPGRGAGADFLRGLSASAGPLALLAALGLAWGLLGPWGGLVVGLPVTGVALWTAWLARRLGGMTGDALGAGVELTELGVLLVAAAAAPAGRIG